MEQTIRCREGDPEYDVRIAPPEELTPGITAVVRVRDEARNLPWVLPRLLRAVDAVVLVDNGSTDGTVAIAEKLAGGEATGAPMVVREYPFTVSRCGPEHLATPADSVHNLTHFYNWSFSHARTTYTMKWDGDMVLTREGTSTLADLGWRLLEQRTAVSIPHPPLYVASPRLAYLDTRTRHLEPWIVPAGPEFGHVKGFDWEVRAQPEDVERMVLPEGLCFELKWLDSDEFAHWTSEDAFHPKRSPRKIRELEVLSALRAGELERLEHVHRIESPDGRHVIDYVADEWMAGAPRPLRRSA